MDANVTGWLQSLKAEVGGSGAFPTSQTPEWAREMLAYGRISYAATLLLSLATMAVAAWIVRRMMATKFDVNPSDNAMVALISAVAFVIAFAFAVNSAFGLYQVRAMPRLYVVEHLAEMVACRH